MGRLWTSIEHAAASEFGRRHYRGVLAIRVARVVSGPVLVVAAAAAVIAAGVRWGIPALAHGAPVVASWSLNLVPSLVVAGLVVIGVPAALIAWRLWSWRLEYHAPWLTGRIASAAGSALLIAAITIVVWPH